MKIAISVSESEKAKEQQSPYFRALVEAGAKPDELQMVTAADATRLRAEVFDGILLTGGADVDPAFYEEERKYENVHLDRPRDKFEFAWLERALRLHVPVLGICRGAQVVNVKFGGTLYQDLEKDWVSESEEIPGIRHKQAGSRSETAHTVTVTDPESRLAQAIQGNCRVNSLHHQGIKRPGRGLRKTAHAEDGLVEAVETAEEGSYLVAVQWHPEELLHLPEQRKLFHQFLAKCRERAGNRE